MESRLESATELAIGEVRQARQGVHRKIAIEVGANVSGDYCCAIGGVELKPQRFGVLFLPSRTLHEDD